MTAPLARSGSQAQTKLLKSDWNPFFDMLDKGDKLCTPSETIAYKSGAYGLFQPRGSDDALTMRVKRETDFGNIAARLPSESDKDYIKRICPSVSQSESRPPISTRSKVVIFLG